MRFVPRTRIDGRKVSEEQITQQISDLLYGKNTRPYPLSVSETAKMLGVCRTTVYNYLKRMQNIPKSQTGRFKLPKIPLEKRFKHFNRHHKITSDPLVSEWIDDLTTRKGGEPLKGWKTRVRSVEVVCNSCKIHPSDLLVSQRNTEKILRQYAQLCREKKAIIEKFQTMEIMEKTLKENLKTLISKHEHDSEIKIIWNPEHDTYDAVIKA